MAKSFLEFSVDWLEDTGCGIIQIKSEYIRNISFAKLTEIDEELKDYGITLFINQISALDNYKIQFPTLECLTQGEYVVFAYVLLDNGIGLSTMVNSIANNEEISFQLNIIYITNYSRMVESLPFCLTIYPQSGTTSNIVYRFSQFERFSHKIRTYEIIDNTSTSLENKPVARIVKEYLIDQQNQTPISKRPGLPNLFPRVYKAFDTRDSDELLECCNEYKTLTDTNKLLEYQNWELRREIEELKTANATGQAFLLHLQGQINTVLDHIAIPSSPRANNLKQLGYGSN
jgi:hypothetical protein